MSCNKDTENRNGKYRLCQQFDEGVELVISACPILAKDPYVKRHKVCAQLHFTLCKERGGNTVRSESLCTYKRCWK